MSLGEGVFSKLVTFANLASHSQSSLPVILHTGVHEGCALSRQITWALTLAGVKWYRCKPNILGDLSYSAVTKVLRSSGVNGPVLQVGSNFLLDPICSFQMLQSLSRFNFLKAEDSLPKTHRLDSWERIRPFAVWSRDFLKGVAPLLLKAHRTSESQQDFERAFEFYTLERNSKPSRIDAYLSEGYGRALLALNYHLEVIEQTLAASSTLWLGGTGQPHLVDLMAGSVVYSLIFSKVESKLLVKRRLTMRWFENLMWYIGEEDPVQDVGQKISEKMAKKFLPVNAYDMRPWNLHDAKVEQLSGPCLLQFGTVALPSPLQLLDESHETLNLAADGAQKVIYSVNKSFLV